jgi:hypothetical protein
VLSSVGLVIAFRPWLRVLDPWVAPLAALLFGTTWFVLLYGPQAMPNLYVGLAAVAVVGRFLRAVQSGTRGQAVAAGVAAAVLALVRPSDSVLVVGPVLVVGLLVRRLRRPVPLVALLVGDAVGWLPWIVEAFLRFGGPIARLGAAEETGPGTLVLDPTDLLAVPRLLDGVPLYFRNDAPLSAAGPVETVLSLWLAVLLLLVLVSAAAGAAQRRLPELTLLYLPAAVLAVFYLVLTPFTALRFVIPVFALLSVPAATAAVHLVRTGRGPLRVVLAVALAVGVLGQVTGAAVKTARYAEHTVGARDRSMAAADALRPRMHRQHCLVVGVEPQAIGFYLGCRVQNAISQTRSVPSRVRDARNAGDDVVAVLPRPPSEGSYLAPWRVVDVPGLPRGLTAYVPRA